jgi:hypothetical protein
MVVSPLLRGLLGLESDALAGKMRFAPHLPADWEKVGVHGIPFAGARVDLQLHRDANVLTLEIGNSGSGSFTLDFAPAYPLCARLTAADVDGRAVTWKEESEYKDWHPHFLISVGPGRTTLTVHHHGLFGYALPFVPPRLGEPSVSLKIVSTRWNNDARTLTLTVSGRPLRDYRLDLVNSGQLMSVDGASLGDEGELTVHMPAGAADEYVNRQIVFSLR